MIARRGTFLLITAILACQAAYGATLSLSVESEAIHANMPFTLMLSAKGFEEEPTPTPPDLAIDGCEVTYLGVSPNVSSRVEIVNGRRSDWRAVTFVYRWRVLAPSAGRYTVPTLRVEQAAVEARSPAATFEASDVPSTRSMVVRMRLPERPVWVGETIDATIEWLLERDVRDYRFAVPLFDLDGVEVVPAEAGSGARTVPFQAGARQIDLPLARATVKEGGTEYTRFSFAARVTLNRAGTVDLAPVRVVARLQAGTARDSWGFSRSRYELFRAHGEPSRLTVRPLPLAGRPATFVNAIGSGFSLDVQASRTVVSLGEPVELSIRLRGDGPLTGVSLPSLGGPEGLPPTRFSVPEGSIAGEIDEQSNSKRFRVTVRVKSAEVREIPPIAFSYFDPAAGEYRTVTSEPVALSVGAGQVVGVADVVGSPSFAGKSDRHSAVDTGAGAGIATLVGADMSLSGPTRTLATPWGTGDVRNVLAALYCVPVLVVLGLVWLARGDDRRARGRSVRRALSTLERALDGGEPARQAAPRIVAAMRRLAEVSGGDRAEAAGLLEQLETGAFNPAAGDEAVTVDVAAELRRIAHRWARATPNAPPTAVPLDDAPSLIVGFVAVGLFATALFAFAASAAPDKAPDKTPEESAAEEARSGVEMARETYQSALEESDRLRRVRLFANAENALRSLAAAHGHAPELQVDWGNAALGAQDPGRAVLAYRRALKTAPDNERARANLAWLRDRLPGWLPRPATAGALDSLLFWREAFTAWQLHLIGGAAFAVGVLLLAPWRRRPQGLRALALPALIVWIVATGSALLARDGGDQAVVLLDSATLRSADSAGASPTFANPLPAGTEITVVESRDAWVRVALADGTRGWLAASAVEWVESATADQG